MQSPFSTKSTLAGGINRIHDEIQLKWNEICLDGEWVDLISFDAVASNFTIYGVNYFTVSTSERFH